MIFEATFFISAKFPIRCNQLVRLELEIFLLPRRLGHATTFLTRQRRISTAAEFVWEPASGWA